MSATQIERSGRLILNDILNSDYRDLAERVEKNRDAINVVGICGESPAHIAIYKNDKEMVELLLSGGAHPNTQNSMGDTLFHIASRLGYFHLLELLYNTKMCNLMIRNKANQLAYDIARSSVERADVHSLKLYAEYQHGEADDAVTIEIMKAGRIQCAKFLQEKMVFDRQEQVRAMVQSTLEDTAERRRKATIVRGVGAKTCTSFYPDITYNMKLTREVWREDDVNFFKGYNEGIEKVVRLVFAMDYINKSFRVGIKNALIRLDVKIENSLYPVHVPDAIIPNQRVEDVDSTDQLVAPEPEVISSVSKKQSTSLLSSSKLLSFRHR